MPTLRTTRLSFLLLIALFSVSSSSVIVRFLPALPAAVIAFWRMALASAIFGGYGLFRPRGKLPTEHKKSIFFAGVFLGFHFACFFSSVKLTTIANATLLGTVAPIFTVFIEAVFLKRKVSIKVFFGILVAVFGIIIINWKELGLSGTNSTGNLLALAGSFFIAVVFILAEKIRQNTSTIIYCRTIYFYAACTLFLVSFSFGFPLFIFNTFDFTLLVFLAVIPTIFGHSLLSYLAKYTSPSTVASVPLGEPAIASCLAYFLFLEKTPPLIFAGGCLILTGLYFILRGNIKY